MLEWFVFIDSRSIERISIERANIAYHGDGLIQDRQKEGRREGHAVL